MKMLWTVLALPFAFTATLSSAQRPASVMTAEPGGVRAVRVEATINAPVSEVWRVWTTSNGAEEFFAQKANIQLAIGGPYEIQFDPKDERSGSKGLKVLSYAPQEMISFQWNAPPEYPEVRNGGTWVVVQMRPEGTAQTHIIVTHLGWKEGPQWDAAYAHFVLGWSGLVDRLQKRFSDGPIDWSKESMIYQKQKP